jgi:Zn-dependent alcohol dehydrogenase
MPLGWKYLTLPRGAVSVANPQSWNRYGYVRNNPLALVDPFGLFTTTGNTGWGATMTMTAVVEVEMTAVVVAAGDVPSTLIQELQTAEEGAEAEAAPRSHLLPR